MLRFILSSLTVLAVFLGAIFLAPTAEALDTSVEEAFGNLATHFELSGELTDYPFVYWIDGSGKTCLKIFPANTTSISIARQSGDSDNYFYAVPSPLPNEPTVYTLFYINSRAYYSNDWSAVNMDFSRLTEFNLSGSFPDSAVTFPAPITGGKTFGYTQVALSSQITSISSAGLLSELYDVSFVVEGVSDDKHSSLISRSLAVTPTAVVDDTGYNLIYLEVPQLGTDLYHNDVIWGYYLFRPRYDTDKYFFNGLKLSFAYDSLQDTSDLTSYPASSFFGASVNSQPLSPNGGLTVNSMSFLFGGSVHTYSNRFLNGYDYSSSDSNLYPTFMFHTIATCNRYSAGSFCYNFDDSGLMIVDEQGNAYVATDDDKDDLADDGNNRNDDTKEELGFVPRAVNYPSLVQNFDYNADFSQYDFSGSKSLFDIIFEHEYIMSIFFMSIVFGILGYVLFGKG